MKPLATYKVGINSIAEWWTTPPRRRSFLYKDTDYQTKVQLINWPWLAWVRLSGRKMPTVMGVYVGKEKIVRSTPLLRLVSSNCMAGGRVCSGDINLRNKNIEEIFFNTVFTDSRLFYRSTNGEAQGQLFNRLEVAWLDGPGPFGHPPCQRLRNLKSRALRPLEISKLLHVYYHRKKEV